MDVPRPVCTADQHGAAKLLHRLDDVIGRRHQHDGVGSCARDQGGAEADARRRVAAARFADDAIRRQRRQLLRRLGTVGFAGDDPGPFRRHQCLDAVKRPAATASGRRSASGTAWVAACRLRGQNRVPPPPAMIIACSMEFPPLNSRYCRLAATRRGAALPTAAPLRVAAKQWWFATRNNAVRQSYRRGSPSPPTPRPSARTRG